jgi:prophage antirepressor-like protein
VIIKLSLDEDALSSIEVIDTMGRKQTVTVINESNLYRVIFQSRKEETKRFNKSNLRMVEKSADVLKAKKRMS